MFRDTLLFGYISPTRSVSHSIAEINSQTNVAFTGTDAATLDMSAQSARSVSASLAQSVYVSLVSPSVPARGPMLAVHLFEVFDGGALAAGVCFQISIKC